MFVLVLAGVAGLAVSGWLITRDRYVDDELHLGGAAGRTQDDELVEVAGTEPPVTVHRPGQDAASRRGGGSGGSVRAWARAGPGSGSRRPASRTGAGPGW